MKSIKFLITAFFCLLSVSVSAQSLFNVHLKDGSVVTYNNSDVDSIVFVAATPDPQEYWGEWVEVPGTHTYTYSTYYSGEDVGVHVFTRSSLLNPNIVQYMVYLNAYNNGSDYCPMTIELDRSTGYCRVLPFWTGNMYDYGDAVNPVMTGDIISAVYATGFNPLKLSALADYNNQSCPSVFNEETGLFRLYMLTYLDGLGYFGYDYETLQLDGYKKCDYSATLTYQGQQVSPDGTINAIVSLQLGADVASYKYGFVNRDASSQINNLYNEIHNGTVEGGEGTESRDLIIPAKEGYNTVAVVTYDKDGWQVGKAYITFEIQTNGSDDKEDTWVSMGYGRLTDDIFSSLLFSDETDTWITYSVEIFKNTENPGLYRLKNPYSPDVYPVSVSGATYPVTDVYVEINAEDPDGVYIPYQSVGADWGLGEFYIYSMASYLLDQGATWDQVKADNAFGTMKNNVITFPAKALLWTGAGMGSLYYGNAEGNFKVDMSNLTAEPTEPETGKAWTGKPSQRKSVIRGEQMELAPALNMDSADWNVKKIRLNKTLLITENNDF